MPNRIYETIAIFYDTHPFTDFLVCFSWSNQGKNYPENIFVGTKDFYMVWSPIMSEAMSKITLLSGIFRKHV